MSIRNIEILKTKYKPITTIPVGSKVRQETGPLQVSESKRNFSSLNTPPPASLETLAVSGGGAGGFGVSEGVVVWVSANEREGTTNSATPKNTEAVRRVNESFLRKVRIGIG
ncbi:MAG: hypothetical protein Q7K40_01740 [bacterium]|nr:hypothetical protein [bacterium]